MIEWIEPLGRWGSETCRTHCGSLKLTELMQLVKRNPLPPSLYASLSLSLDSGKTHVGDSGGGREMGGKDECCGQR